MNASSSSPSPVAPAIAPPTGSPWGVFFTPRAAMTSLITRPRALLLVALLLAGSVVPALAFVSQADVAGAMERQMKRTGTWDKLPGEDRGATVKKIADAMVYLGPAGAFLKRFFYLFGIALLAWFLLKATRPDLRFAVVIAATALGLAPILLQDILETLVFFVRDPTTLNLDAPLRSNLGAFLPAKTNPKLLALATGVDLFGLWVSVLIGFGLRVVSHSTSIIPYLISFAFYFAGVALAVLSAG